MEILNTLNSLNKFAPKKVAIIGAGVSSLSFIYSVKSTDKISIDLFERSKVLSGRCSTRKTDGYIYDNGANYISTSNERVLNTIINELDTEELTTIKKWIFPFDKNNNINFNLKEVESHNIQKKYSYISGLNKIGNLLYDKIRATDFKLHYSTNIEKLIKNEEGWEIHTKDSKFGNYDCVIFGTPPFNLAKVLNNSSFALKEDEEFYKSEVVGKLNEVKYKKIYSLAIAFENEKLNSNNLDFYALINSDREHPVSWISVENEKEGRIPDDKKNTVCFIVQMSDEFSEINETGESSDVTQKIIEEVDKLIPGVKKSKVIFSNLKLWRVALPRNTIDQNILNKMKERDFYLIGDSLIGKGRIDAAMLTGFELYDFLSSKLV